MKRFGRIGLVAAVAAAATVQAARAQLPAIPYGPVETGLGVNLSADYGKQDTKAGGQSGYGVTGGIGFSRFGLSASVGALKPTIGGVSAQTSVAGRIGMKLFGGGLVPLTVGAQVGASSANVITPAIPPATGTVSTRTTTILPALWVRVSPPLFPLKPWGQVYYVAGNSSVTKEARFAVGANFNLLLGLGVHAAYDWGNKGGGWWGVGAHVNIRVPSLGVPGVPGI